MIEIFTAEPWQMTLGERAALEGVLASLRPQLAIEIGTAEGGSLRRIAAHSREVHSFDLVEPSLPVQEWGDVTLHTGDSHALVPEFLAELSVAGRNVDFVLVDGDHSADGVERDLNDLLASPAIGRTIILVHDTANDEVRRGVERVRFGDHERVALWDPDFVAGHLSHGGAYHHELWGGLGLVVVDPEFPRHPAGDPHVYTFVELVTRARDALVTAEEADIPVGPGAVPSLQPAAPEDGETGRLRGELERMREELNATRWHLDNARRGSAALQASTSWRVTAPLRGAKRRLRDRARR